MIEVQAKLIIEKNVDIVISGILKLKNNILTEMRCDGCNLEEGLYEGERLLHIKQNLFGNINNRNGVFNYGCINKIFRKELLLNNLDYSDNSLFFGDDVCLVASAIYDSERIYYTHKSLYIYRIRDNSLTTSQFNPKLIHNDEILISSVRKMITDKGYMNDFIYYNDPTYHILYIMRKINNMSCDKKQKKVYCKELIKSDLVKDYNLRKAKRYISYKRYIAIWMLKHSMFSLLLKIL
jgi:hypothetical protein